MPAKITTSEKVIKKTSTKKSSVNPLDDKEGLEVVKKTRAKRVSKPKIEDASLDQTVQKNKRKTTVKRKQISEEDIALRAWQIWCEQGCQHGQDKENWDQAVRELTGN